MSPGPSLHDSVHIMHTNYGMVTNFDLIMYGFSCLITFPYICIFKFFCFASICNTSIYVFVKRYTIHGLTYVDIHNMQILQSVRTC